MTALPPFNTSNTGSSLLWKKSAAFGLTSNVFHRPEHGKICDKNAIERHSGAASNYQLGRKLSTVLKLGEYVWINTNSLMMAIFKPTPDQKEELRFCPAAVLDNVLRLDMFLYQTV